MERYWKERCIWVGMNRGEEKNRKGWKRRKREKNGKGDLFEESEMEGKRGHGEGCKLGERKKGERQERK